MNTRHIDTFITVAGYASINAAAEALFLSPPALQQQLNRLEDEIGFRLFDRSPGGIHLTQAGSAFLDGMQKIRASTEQLIARCQGLDSMRNCIRIGAIEGLKPDLFPRLSEPFYRKYPNVVQKPVMESEEQLFADLDAGMLDAVEYYDCPKAHAMGRSFLPLIFEGRDCLMGPGHPLANRKELTPEDLRGQHIIVFRFDRVPGFREYMEANYPDVKLSEEAKIVDFYTIVRSFEDGHISLVPSHLAQLFAPLRAIPLRLDLKWSVGLVYREPCSATLKAFIEVAQQVLGTDRQNPPAAQNP